MFDLQARKGVLLVVAAFVALLLPAVARADAPVLTQTLFVRDFENPSMCTGFVVHGHAISDQAYVGFSDGTYSVHVDEDETFSYGTRYVTAHNRYNFQGAYGFGRSRGSFQLWSADGSLLYTAAGQSIWTIADGLDWTPQWDPDPIWNLICEQLRP